MTEQTPQRTKFLKYSQQYFTGEITTLQLFDKLKKITSIAVHKNGYEIPKKDRIMLIANHPSADHTLTIPATTISGLKGGNTRNFPSFWFPVIRQLLLYELFGSDNRFVTIAHDIGWSVAMQELYHFPITSKPGGRCNYIIASLRHDIDCSIVIFPEGRASCNMQALHSGFIAIAHALQINTIVTSIFPKLLSLNAKNYIKIINSEKTVDFIKNPTKSLDQKRLEMLRHIS